MYSGSPNHIFDSRPYSICAGNDLLDQFLIDWNSQKVPTMGDIVDWVVPDYDSISFMKNIQFLEKSYLWSRRIYEKKWFAVHLKILDEEFDKLAMDEWITQQSICGEFLDIEMRAKCGFALGHKKTEISTIIRGIPPSPEDFECFLKGFECSLGLPCNTTRKYVATKISYEAYHNRKFFNEDHQGIRCSFSPLLGNLFTMDDVKNYYVTCMTQAFRRMSKVNYVPDIKEEVQKKETCQEESFLKKTCPCNHLLCNGSKHFTLTPMCFLPLSIC